MIDEVLKELIEFVKTASPVIWEALYRQVFVEALSSFLWAIGVAVLAVILVRLAKWAMAKKEEDGYMSDWEILYGFSYFFAGVAGIVAFYFLVSAIKYVANPNFYAIKFILENLNGG